MAALTTKQIVATTVSLTPTFSAATVTTGDTFVPGSRTFLVVRTTSNATDVTVQVPGNVSYTDAAKPDVVVSMDTSAEKWIGPLPADPFANSTTGLGTVVCSNVTGVTLGVFQI